MGSRLDESIYWTFTGVTTGNYNTIANFRFTNRSTPVFSVYLHYSSLFVSWRWIYNTLTENKSSNHTLSLHRLTSDFSSTSNFPWLSPNDNRNEFPFPYTLIFFRHGPRTEITAPRDRYLACSLARWLLPSNRKHCSYSCVLERIYRVFA
jgi:hypothetical protein